MTTAETPANPNKALWEKGDFTKIAATMRENGARLVASLGIRPGLAMLDLGCGDGTTALPAAELGADVTGIDIAANLVAAGQARALSLGLTNIRFEEGDATHLDQVADESFDLVLSMFGAMFAPRPFDVAKEMVRVTRPGGRIIMGNWIPGDPTLVAQILQVSAAYTPPPPAGFVSPMSWGDEAQVRERFEAAGISAGNIGFERVDWTFQFDGSPTELLATFRDFYGPMMSAFDAARQSDKAAQLEQELTDLFEKQNQASVGSEMPAVFLKVTVHRD